MKSLLELGKSLVGEMKCQYKDCFYRYVDENSFNDETYLAIGKKLFSDKEKYIDYMSHIYEEDFDWTQSNVNSFDYIQNIVDIAIKESNKYIWSDEYNAHIPVIKYDSSFRSIPLTNFKNPCCIKNFDSNEEVYAKGFVECGDENGYDILSENNELIFLGEKTDNFYDYIDSRLFYQLLNLTVI